MSRVIRPRSYCIRARSALRCHPRFPGGSAPQAPTSLVCLSDSTVSPPSRSFAQIDLSLPRSSRYSFSTDDGSGDGSDDLLRHRQAGGRCRYNRGIFVALDLGGSRVRAATTSRCANPRFSSRQGRQSAIRDGQFRAPRSHGKADLPTHNATQAQRCRWSSHLQARLPEFHEHRSFLLP